MLFNSLQFALFLPVVFALHWALPHRWRWLLLLLASYVFYMAWQPAYAVLILASTAIDYFVAVGMDGRSDRARRGLLAISLVTNLGLLFSFKYYNLINSTFVAAAARVGVDWPLPESSLLLPVGISFYTFQTIGYTVDVYRGTVPPQRHFGLFALYVSYFPQLVAGPIERAGRLMPQLAAERHWDLDRIVSGFRRAAWGLFKKVVIADRMADVVNTVFANPQEFSGFALMIGVLFFASQLYCDFSGYCDIAVGVARMLGVELMENFDQPHLARSFAGLWNRWHISLTTWFRDYVYFPLGGNRVSQSRWALNVLAVFALSGMWHGATWGYLVWGLANGALLVIERWSAPARAAVVSAIGLDRRPALHGIVQWAITFSGWLATIVFFRANDLSDGLYILTHLPLGWSHAVGSGALLGFLQRVGMDALLFTYTFALFPLSELVDYLRRDPRAVQAWREAPAAVRWAGDYAVIFGVLFLGNFERVPFLYFQF